MRWEGNACDRHSYNKQDFHIYSQKGFCDFCDFCDFYREEAELQLKEKNERELREKETCDNCYYGILDECGFYVNCHYYPEEVVNYP